MSKALEILTKIKEEKLNNYWSTMKEYRMPLRNELDEIDEAIKEIEYWIEMEEKYM